MDDKNRRVKLAGDRLGCLGGSYLVGWGKVLSAHNV